MCSYSRCIRIYECRVDSNQRFCSKECFYENRKRLSREVKICFICGKTFECYRKENRKYCGKKCESEGRKGEIRPEEVGKKISEAKSGCKFSEEHKRKLREANLGENSPRWIPRETRFCGCGCGGTFECKVNSKQRYIHGHHNRTESFRKQQSEKKKGRLCPKISEAKQGHEVSEETRRKLRKARKGKTYEEIFGERAEEEKRKKREKWQDPKYVAKQMKSRHVKPNKPEKFLTKLFQKLFPNQWKYVGDGKDKNAIIAGKCPDFINISGQKKIIEHFGDFHHGLKRTGRTNVEEEQQKINHYAKYGFQTLVIWEHELKDINNVMNRILEFNNV